MRQTNRAARDRDRLDNIGLDIILNIGRSQINGFLKVRTIQWIRLVENSEALEVS